MDYEEFELIVALGSSASLDRSPKKNWVENAGNLPPYVREMARSIEKSGKSLSAAIAIAISRIKKLAATSKDPKVKAKAAKAVAQWEALKAKSKGKQVVKATHADGSEYLMLAARNFNVDAVRNAFYARKNEERSANPTAAYDYMSIREMWTNYMIVDRESTDGMEIYRIDYDVDAKTSEITFSEPVRVKVKYTTAALEPDDANYWAKILGFTADGFLVEDS